MAIQAQIPANFLPSDFHIRPTSLQQEECCLAVDDNDPNFGETFLQLYSSGLNAMQGQPENNHNHRELDLDTNLLMRPVRKKPRQEAVESLNLTHSNHHQHMNSCMPDNIPHDHIGQFTVPMLMSSQIPSSTSFGQFTVPAIAASQPASVTTQAAGCSNPSKFGLGTHHVASNHAVPQNALRRSFWNSTQPMAPGTASVNKDPLIQSSILNGNSSFQLQFLKQQEDIHQIVQLYEERMNQALEDGRRRHTGALLTLVDKHLMLWIQEKEAEIEKVRCRNMELESLVKHLKVESQFWQSVAQNNETIVANLRNNLQHAVAETRIQNREGCGESEAEDMESCVHRAADDQGNDLNAVDENHNVKCTEFSRMCRVCCSNNVCVLVLPCRHLCLCSDCDPQTPNCPVCGILKNASVQVYIE